MTARRIGLYGGTFDPVHVAHTALAQSALDALGLDHVRWVPAGQPWQKTRAVTPAADRIAMLQLALHGMPGHVIDTIEIDRAGPSYTLDTVRALQAVHPGAEWWLLLGADQHAGFTTWHGWQELLGHVRLAVAQRPGAAAATGLPAAVVPLAPLAVSASEVRRRVAAGLDISSLVAPGVARYIDLHALYRAGS